MKLITKVAYFRLCPSCGCHGHIVQPDGSQGVDFTTKKEGYAQVRDLYLRKIIPSADEASFLKEEIEKSSLPEEEPPHVALIRAIVQQELPNAFDDESDTFGGNHTIH